jgi:hypothetical protein
MKKMILLLVSGLLIASMAGSAMAGDIIINQPIHSVTLDPAGSSATVSLTFNQLTPNVVHTAGTKTTTTGSVANPKLEARLTGLPDGALPTPWSVTNSGNWATGTYTPTIGTYPVTLEIQGNSPGVVEITDYQTGHTYVVEVYIESNIPEFPTVALPVAGVLGLLFVFGRKKEGL